MKIKKIINNNWSHHFFFFFFILQTNFVKIKLRIMIARQFLGFLGVFSSGLLLGQDRDLYDHIKELRDRADKFNVYLNTQSAFEVSHRKNEDTQAGFKINQVRLELRGDLTDKIFYRLRHRLNSSTDNSNSFDNLSMATDLFYVGFRLSDKVSILGGKVLHEAGGFEIYYNPIQVYEYSDFVDYIEGYMVGETLTYMPNEKHEFNVNVMNSRNQKFEVNYGENTGIEQSGAPLTYTLNWNGNLFDKKLQTRWSISYHQEAKGYATKMYVLGTKLNLPKFQIFLDYMGSTEDLSKTEDLQAIGEYGAIKDVVKNTFLSKAEYQPSEKLNIFVQGMYEKAKSGEALVEVITTKKYSLGYQLGVEYVPFKDQDLKFYAAYLGKKYHYHNPDYDTYRNRFGLGLIYRIKAF